MKATEKHRHTLNKQTHPTDQTSETVMQTWTFGISSIKARDVLRIISGERDHEVLFVNRSSLRFCSRR